MKFGIALATAFFAATLTASAEEIVLKAGHAAAPGEPYQLGFEKFAEIVADRSDGEIKIEIFPSGQLGSELEMIEQMIIGTLDFQTGTNAYWTNFVPELKPLDIPYLIQSAEHADAVRRSSTVLDLINNVTQERGLRVLAFNSGGFQHVMTKFPINSIEDLQRVKLRVIPNPIFIEAFQMMGANPTPLPYAELYGALQTGIVDGATAANTNYFAQKFYEVAPHWAMISYSANLSPFGMSQKTYDRLSDEHRAIIESAAIEASLYQAEVYAMSDAEKLVQLKELGVQVTTPDRDQFIAAVEDLPGEVLSEQTEIELADLIKSLK